jgi:membrane-associated phospholipid phosphatase
MPEQHITLNNQNEEAVEETVVVVALQTKPTHVHVARHISNILSPAVISLPLVFLVALYRSSNQASNLYYALITLFFASIGPLLYIVIGVRLGKFTDVDVSVRSQRTGPFLFGLGSCFLGLLVIAQTHGPKNLQTLMIMTIISGIILMITTMWWKISIHASTLAGAVTLLTALYGLVMLPAYLLVILVSWSRVVLHRHTIAQVTAGSLVSIAMTLILLKIRGI